VIATKEREIKKARPEYVLPQTEGVESLLGVELT